ncbi:MAG: fasciclin domain-containing protein [Chitinophagaceae bacterium]
MKLKTLNKIKNTGMAALAAAFVFSSCNKELPSAVPIVTTLPSGNTIGDLFNTDTTYSIFKAAIVKAGMLPLLSDRSLVFTVYAPNNAAFRFSGIASEAVIAALPTAQVTSIVQYHVVGGQSLTTSLIPTSFPNVQEASSLVLSAPFLRMSIFPSRRGTSNWVNNIPVSSPDIALANGTVHQMAALVSPPSTVLAGILYTDPNLTYFSAAIARADSGATGLNKIDSLLRYPPLSMTVLAPTNAAFMAVLDTNIRRALIAQGLPSATAAAQATALAASPTVFSNPALYGTLTAATVKGIVVYHILASKNTNPAAFQPDVRAFSPNFPTTPGFVTTLVNSALAIHPGIMAQASFTGPFATGLKFTGLGTLPTGGAPFSGPAANAIALDRHAINGVTHTIDRVLLPQ